MKSSTTLNFITTSLVAGFLAVASAQAATFQWDGGASSGDWTAGNNWNPNGTAPTTGVVTSDRININGAQESVYSAAQGATTFGGANIRGLVIGSGATTPGGTLRITGGSLTTVGTGGTDSAYDIVGNTAGSAAFIIDGGSYTSNGLVINLNSSTGVVTLNGGTATIGTLKLGPASGTGGATVNLNGGTLKLSALQSDGIANGGSVTRVMNFNGGTLQAGVTFSFPTTNVISNVVKSGGAKIDTNGFDVTIDNALAHDSGLGGTADGGLTKTGAGTLNLNAANTYTGVTKVSAGTLSLGQSAAITSTAKVILDGGTLQSAFNQSLGMLDLTASSTLDLSTGGTFVFADSSSLESSWSGTLSISGTFTDGASVKFGIGGLTSNQLSQISINGNAATLDGSGFLSTAVPIPEPSSYVMLAGLLVLGMGFLRRTRCRSSV